MGDALYYRLRGVGVGVSVGLPLGLGGALQSGCGDGVGL